MISILEQRRFAIPLFGLLVAIACALVVIFIMRNAHVGAVINTPARAVASPVVEAELRSVTTDFSTVRLRSVFYATREYYVAPDPAMVVPLPSKPNYILMGTLQAPGKPRTAMLVQAETRHSVKVSEGDEIEGWRVKTVEGARVVLQLDNEWFEIARQGFQKNPGLLSKPLSRGQASDSGNGVRALNSTSNSLVNESGANTLSGQSRLYAPPPG